MRLKTLVILIFTLAGFGLRLHYLITTHPFLDEYTTVLAARQILRHGWPILPSGLFYEHGLLATYLIVPFTALFIDTPLSEWQPAHWGLMLSRWPSVLLGTVTIPLIYTLGQRGFNPKPALSEVEGSQIRNTCTCAALRRKCRCPKSSISLLAAGLFALSPEGMVWGGRARMYALATLLILLTVYWAYRGATGSAPAKYRWWALLALLATLLTQLGAIMLVPPLVGGMVVVGWFSSGRGARKQIGYVSRVWFLRPAVLLEGTALAAVIGLAIFVKRLGRPLGAAVLGSAESNNLLAELLNTVTYQTAFYFTWTGAIKFLSRQFGVPHHFWLTLVTLTGGVIGLIFWLSHRIRNEKLGTPPTLPTHRAEVRRHPCQPTGQGRARQGHASERRASVRNGWWPVSDFQLFLWLVFGLIIFEMVTLLEPFRRNPRYIVMYLPLFYLIAANAINYQLSTHRASVISYQLSRFFSPISHLPFSVSISNPLAAIVLLVLFTLIGFNDLRVALLTPEPAYEEAFARIQAGWQPGDTLLTINTTAAGLYLGHADGFTIQAGADQFLLNAGAAPVDRWLGVPWLGNAADFNAAINTTERAWFVIDAIRQPVYFRGDWLAVVNSQMEQVWAKDNALIYRTRPDRVPLTTHPETLLNATLGDAIQLIGYTLQIPDRQSQSSNSAAPISKPESQGARLEAHRSEPKLTLFWQALTALPTDYTTFLHLRNRDGATVAQYDGQPLDGTYPTSHWQPGETVIDPITLPLSENLPAGSYSLFIGLYQLDTLERLPVANDTSGENAILLGEITLP